MIFSKEFIAEKFQEKVGEIISQIFPFETNEKPGEVSSGKNMIISYYQYFDLKSEEIKDLKVKALNEINEVCFAEDNLGIYPNSEKINNCIQNIQTKHLGKVLDSRNLYFGNGNFYF